MLLLLLLLVVVVVVVVGLQARRTFICNKSKRV